eukprot:1988987-Prymnesium_polylepis.1
MRCQCGSGIAACLPRLQRMRHCARILRTMKTSSPSATPSPHGTSPIPATRIPTSRRDRRQTQYSKPHPTTKPRRSMPSARART